MRKRPGRDNRRKHPYPNPRTQQRDVTRWELDLHHAIVIIRSP